MTKNQINVKLHLPKNGKVTFRMEEEKKVPSGFRIKAIKNGNEVIEFLVPIE